MTDLQNKLQTIAKSMVNVFYPQSFRWKLCPQEKSSIIGVFLPNDVHISFKQFEKIKQIDYNSIQKVWVEYLEQENELLCCCEVKLVVESRGRKRIRTESPTKTFED